MLVDDDPIRHLESGIGRELDIGHDADADEHEIGRNLAPASRHDARGALFGTAAYFGHAVVEDEGDAAFAMHAQEGRCGLDRQAARHRPIGALDHRDLLAERARHACAFKPDETRADDDELAGSREPLLQRVGIRP